MILGEDFVKLAQWVKVLATKPWDLGSIRCVGRPGDSRSGRNEESGIYFRDEKRLGGGADIGTVWESAGSLQQRAGAADFLLA